MNKIYRNFELRSVDSESRTIIGQAIVFDSWSRNLGGFHEIIRSSAVTQELVDNSDVIMNINHDDNQMVARWNQGKGTLRLELREDGLWFSFEAPETERGNELLWNIRNGNLFECSFAFSLPDNDTCQRWYRENGELKREITEIGGLYDTSIVVTAAYGSTSVSAREEIDIDYINRCLDSEEAEEARKELERAAEEAEKQKNEIVSILNNRRDEFLKNINI